MEDHGQHTQALGQVPQGSVERLLLAGFGLLPRSLFLHIAIQAAHEGPDGIQGARKVDKLPAR